MKIRYNRHVPRDVQEIRNHYISEAGSTISGEFFDELLRVIEQAAANPRKFHPDIKDCHRANLERFPYHFRYRIRNGCIYVLIVKHHKRHPSFGLHRK